MERNINVWVPLGRPLLETWSATQACALTGNRTSDTLVRRLALNPLSHTGLEFFYKEENSFINCFVTLESCLGTVVPG